MAKRPKEEVGWQVFQMRGNRMVSLGIVYAVDEAAAVKKAATEYKVAEALQSRLIARPWLP